MTTEPLTPTQLEVLKAYGPLAEEAAERLLDLEAEHGALVKKYMALLDSHAEVLSTVSVIRLHLKDLGERQKERRTRYTAPEREDHL